LLLLQAFLPFLVLYALLYVVGPSLPQVSILLHKVTFFDSTHVIPFLDVLSIALDFVDFQLIASELFQQVCRVLHALVAFVLDGMIVPTRERLLRVLLLLSLCLLRLALPGNLVLFLPGRLKLIDQIFRFDFGRLYLVEATQIVQLGIYFVLAVILFMGQVSLDRAGSSYLGKDLLLRVVLIIIIPLFIDGFELAMRDPCLVAVWIVKGLFFFQGLWVGRDNFFDILGVDILFELFPEDLFMSLHLLLFL